MDAFCAVCSGRLAEGVKFCGECGAPIAGSAEAPSKSTVTSTYDSPLSSPLSLRSQSQPDLQVKIRDADLLRQGKKFRMTAPLTAIGYLLLIPAVLGSIFSVILLYGARRFGQIDLAGGILFGLISCVGGVLLWLLFVAVLPKKNQPEWDKKYAPLLAGFPLDLMFSGTLQSKNGDEPLQIVSSVYHFDFSTFAEDSEKRRMTYRSRANSEFRVDVIIRSDYPSIEVSKYRGEVLLWHANGPTLESAIEHATSPSNAGASGAPQDEAENLSLTPSFATRMSLHVTPQ